MADVIDTPQYPTSAGITPVDVTAGHALNDDFYFHNDGRQILVFQNRHASTALVVTFDTPVTVDGLAVADRTVSVPGNSFRAVGALPPNPYNAQSGDHVNQVHYTLAGPAITDVSVFLFQSGA